MTDIIALFLGGAAIVFAIATAVLLNCELHAQTKRKVEVNNLLFRESVLKQEELSTRIGLNETLVHDRVITISVSDEIWWLYVITHRRDRQVGHPHPPNMKEYEIWIIVLSIFVIGWACLSFVFFMLLQKQMDTNRKDRQPWMSELQHLEWDEVLFEDDPR